MYCPDIPLSYQKFRKGCLYRIDIGDFMLYIAFRTTAFIQNVLIPSGYDLEAKVDPKAVINVVLL